MVFLCLLNLASKENYFDKGYLQSSLQPDYLILIEFFLKNTTKVLLLQYFIYELPNF